MVLFIQDFGIKGRGVAEVSRFGQMAPFTKVTGKEIRQMARED